MDDWSPILVQFDAWNPYLVLYYSIVLDYISLEQGVGIDSVKETVISPTAKYTWCEDPPQCRTS